MDDSTNLMNETYHGAIGGLAADDYSKVYIRDILGGFFTFQAITYDISVEIF